MSQQLNVIIPLADDHGPSESQRETVEEWKAHVATLFTGAEWVKARTALTASGMTDADAIDALLEAVDDLVSYGWDDYV
jgi:hypothetical protein